MAASPRHTACHCTASIPRRIRDAFAGLHGATDEIGFHAVEHRHYVTDIHATILQPLGLDSRKLEVPGRKRLEIDHGKPTAAIIA